MNLCMGCMEPLKDGAKFCPICGFAVGTKAAEALHMEPGSIMHGRYIVGKVLGFGGFGVTYIGWDALLEQKIAIKEYLPSEFSTRIPGQTQVTVFNGVKQDQFIDGLNKFVEEAQRLAKFHSMDGIVKIYDSFSDNNTAYIIMEYLQGETLGERLNREGTIPAEEAVTMLMPVIQSLKHIHDQGIIHRDIAPDNIFLTKDGDVKLIDFGAARFATTSLTRSLTVIIKPGYSPEEQYRSRGDQGPHTDVYAIGATLYRMVTGTTLPEALERRAYFESKQKDILAPPSKFVKDIDENYETAILNALNVRIEDRTPDMAAFEEELTTDEIVQRRHGRIKKIDVLKWPLWTKIVASVSMVAIVALFVWFLSRIVGPGWGIGDDEFYLTELTGKTEDSANALLAENYSMVDSEQGQRLFGKVAEGLILKQYPSAGVRMKKGTEGAYTVIVVDISRGFEGVKIEPHRGRIAEEVKEELESKGLTVTTEEEENDTIGKGGVISIKAGGGAKWSNDADIEEGYELQAGDELKMGSAVVLLVSMGRSGEGEIKEVPNLVGLPLGEAEKRAEEATFLVSTRSSKYSSEYPVAGTVMGQSLTAGSMENNNETIGLDISLGLILVDDYIRVPKEDAEKELEELVKNGLISYEFDEADSTIAEGLICAQIPEPGVEVGPETVFILTVSRGSSASAETSASPSPSATPSTTPSPTPTTSTSPSRPVSPSPSSPSPTQSQSPPPTQSQSPTPTQSQSPSPTPTQSQSPPPSPTPSESATPSPSPSPDPTVPNVVRDTKDRAKQALEGAGFTVKYGEARHDSSIPKDSVISQSPAANSTAPRGSDVTLILSLGPSISRLSLSPTTLTLGKGATSQLSLTVTPTNADSAGVTWESSNTTVATVSSSGLVTARTAGTANILVKSPDGRVTAACAVTVTEITVVMEQKSVTIDGGKTFQLNALVSGTVANSSVTWSITGAAGVTVSQSGLVTAPTARVDSITLSSTSATLEVGDHAQITMKISVPSGASATATVTATSKDDTSKRDTCTVTINPPDQSVTWSSDNTSVVEVSQDGYILAKSNGTATITVSSNADPTKKATCKIEVKSDMIVAVTGINTQPYKTVYLPGERLDLNGLSFNVRHESGKTGIELYPSPLITQISPTNVPMEAGSWSALIEFRTGDAHLVYYTVASTD